MSITLRISSTLTLLVALVLMLVADQVATARSEPSQPQPEIVAPAVYSAGASTWFCVGGVTGKAGHETTLTVVNPSEEVLSGIAKVFPSVPLGGSSRAWPPVSVDFAVAPRSSEILYVGREVIRSESQLGEFEEVFLSVEVRLNAADAVVLQSVSWLGEGETGNCLTITSPSWYFATLSTRRDARSYVHLFNPHPDDAVLDLSFATDEGSRNPVAYNGVVVPPFTLKVLDLRSEVTRRAQVSLSIDVRSGSVAAARLQIFDGSLGLSGVSLGGGAPQVALQWMFPEGIVSAEPDSSTSLVLYNPNTTEAHVDVSVEIDANLRARPVAPFEFTVPPRQRVQVGFDLFEQHPFSDLYRLDADSRVVASESYWLKVRSYNGVGIVVERQVASVAEGAGQRDFSISSGLSASAEGHILARAASESGLALGLTLLNPSVETISRVRVEALREGGWEAVARLDDLEIRPHQRLMLEIKAPLAPAYRVLSSAPLLASSAVVGESARVGKSRAAIPDDATLSGFDFLLY